MEKLGNFIIGQDFFQFSEKFVCVIHTYSLSCCKKWYKWPFLFFLVYFYCYRLGEINCCKYLEDCNLRKECAESRYRSNTSCNIFCYRVWSGKNWKSHKRDRTLLRPLLLDSLFNTPAFFWRNGQKLCFFCSNFLFFKNVFLIQYSKIRFNLGTSLMILIYFISPLCKMAHVWKKNL